IKPQSHLWRNGVRLLVELEFVVHFVVADHVVKTVALGITAGENASARRRAGRPRNDEICEPDAFRSHSVEIRRLNHRGAKTASIAIAEIIRQKQENVRSAVA